MKLNHSDNQIIALGLMACLFMMANALSTATFYMCLTVAIMYIGGKICVKG